MARLVDFFSDKDIAGPAEKVSAVTPSDSTLVNCKGLYIGGTGNVAVVPIGGGSAVTFNAVPVGFFPVACQKVMSTNTTATNIIALF